MRRLVGKLGRDQALAGRHRANRVAAHFLGGGEVAQKAEEGGAGRLARLHGHSS
ncbi:MAG: hypothetical protein U0841_07175 [Chloroflexia bacterium]